MTRLPVGLCTGGRRISHEPGGTAVYTWLCTYYREPDYYYEPSDPSKPERGER